jgi:hypothetical protein
VAGFEWAEHNLGAETPHGLQDQGVDVHFAPNIPPNVKVVNLANGHIERFFDGEERPQHGYYADFQTLARYCEGKGLLLVETNGQAEFEAIEPRRAGMPPPPAREQG